MSPENTAQEKISLRLLRPSLVVLCGPAGCGKSTFAERHFRATQIISSDWARARISDDERDQRYNSQAFGLVYFLVEQRLLVNRLCVVDSTALTAQARRELLNLAKKHQVPSTLLAFYVPLEVCIERDEKRPRSVGKAVVERQYQAFQESNATIHAEGFDQVVEFHNGDEQSVHIEVLFRPIVRVPHRPEVRGSQRLEESGRPYRPKSSGRGDNGNSAPSVSPEGRPATAPHSIIPSGASSPKVEPLDAGRPPALQTQPTAAPPRPAATDIQTSKPLSLSAASAAKPALRPPDRRPAGADSGR
jgi:predicted kinase